MEGHFGWGEFDKFVDSAKLENIPEFSHWQIQTYLGAIGTAKDYDIWVPPSDRVKLDWSGVVFFENPAHGEEWTAVQKEIWELEESRWKALIQGDLDGFVKYHHEDGAFWPYWSDKPLNLEKFRAYLQQFKFYSADLQPDSIKVFGNTAIVQYTCEYRVTQYGVSIVVVKSRFTETRMRQNGIWQVIGKMLHKVN